MSVSQNSLKSRSLTKTSKSSTGKDWFLLFMGIIGMVALILLFSARFGFTPAAAIVDSITGQNSSAANHNHGQLAPKQSQGIVYATDTRLVNLSDKGSKHYLKVQMGLEFTAPEALDDGDQSAESYGKKEQELRDRLDNRSAILYDHLLTTMSTKTSKELLSTEGQDAIRQDLKSKLAEILDDRTLLDVYFLDFIIG